MMELDERGKLCPMPVIDTKKALERCAEGECVVVLVDNEIAVQNLKKMADHKGLFAAYEKIDAREFVVRITAGSKPGGSVAPEGTIGKNAASGGSTGNGNAPEETAMGGGEGMSSPGETNGSADRSSTDQELVTCQPDSRRKGLVVALSSSLMGQGDDTLGKMLMKGFVYALSQQDILPETVLLYNGGAFLSSEGSDNLEDLKEMEAQGVEILTCGACMKHYGLEDKLKVGSVTNMYEIVERMTTARLLVRP